MLLCIALPEAYAADAWQARTSVTSVPKRGVLPEASAVYFTVFDFQQSAFIDKILLNSREEVFRNVQVALSDDGKSWQALDQLVDLLPGQSQTFPVKSLVRYIRVTAKAAGMGGDRTISLVATSSDTVQRYTKILSPSNEISKKSSNPFVDQVHPRTYPEEKIYSNAALHAEPAQSDVDAFIFILLSMIVAVMVCLWLMIKFIIRPPV